MPVADLIHRPACSAPGSWPTSAPSRTRAVRQWSDGTRIPSDAVVQRLRLAYEIAALLAERDAPTIVQAWLQG